MHDTHYNKFYVTTPIYYVTARPHLGSLYSTLLADVVARWNILQGKQVFFLTGTDEHGQKVAEAAHKANKLPQEFVDSFIHAYKEVWYNYEIAYTHFIRTTDEYHVKAVQKWIARLIVTGDIYKGYYKGWYCTPDETFVTEKDSEVDSSVAPACPSCGRLTVMVQEETYFFKLSAYQDKLLKFYEEHPDFIVPKERAHEVVNFVKAGLKDFSISRTTVTWGIPFPDDAHHVTYVWADALNNYITGIGYGQPGREHEFNSWWPADLHILGKDIVRFHAIYWPAFLMASGLALPKQLLVHGWIKVGDQKMSKSLGNVVDPEVLFKKYGPEPVRYYLVKQMAITHDGEFSIGDLEQKIESDLANDLGNLLNRMVSLAHKNDVIELPAIHEWSERSLELRDESWNMTQEFEGYMEDYLFHMALARLWKTINKTNAYFHEQEPWKLAKTDRARFIEILSATCHSLKTIAVLLWPVMPKKMEQLLHSLGLSTLLTNNTLKNLELNSWGQHFMLHKIPNLFEKPEPKEEVVVVAPAQPEQPQVPEIGIEDFIKALLIIGTVEQAEEVPGSDKLLKLQVNFGPLGMRQILSGVKKSYQPTDLIGKQGVFVTNLKPRKMMGFESHGMMLFAVHDNKQTFVTIAGVVPNGTKVQ
ncbi:MAG: methionine--tRNA ligase [Candidatus Dependentiae bacterium]|nr:methionine--tRNA ligase [Candidatus Dependentiae bacterium]